MDPFVPNPSKPTTTRLEAKEEEREGTIEAEEEGPSRVQISPMLVPTPVLPSSQSLTLPLDSWQETFQGTYLNENELPLIIFC